MFPFFLIFPAASLAKNPLRMALTACRKQRQRIGNLLKLLFFRRVSAVKLMEYLTVPDKEHAPRMTGRFRGVRHHQDRLAVPVDLAENPKQIIDTVSRLRKVGFIVEMDDFGSGYSSLNMLNEMPIDILKLDMKFMQSETAKPVNQGVLRFIMDLARWMKLSVVAEGVETKEQLERLREIGCDYVQGYFFARPMPSLDFEKLMNEQRLSVTPDAAVGRADQHGSA